MGLTEVAILMRFLFPSLEDTRSRILPCNLQVEGSSCFFGYIYDITKQLCRIIFVNLLQFFLLFSKLPESPWE